MFKKFFSVSDEAAGRKATASVSPAWPSSAEYQSSVTSQDSVPQDDASQDSVPQDDGTLRIPFRQLHVQLGQGRPQAVESLGILRPYRGIGLTWPAAAADPFLSALLHAQAARGWSVLLWGNGAASYAAALRHGLAGSTRQGSFPTAMAFRTVGFSLPQRSARVNPLQGCHVRSLDDALQVASSFLSAVGDGFPVGSDFHRHRIAMENLLAAAILFMVRRDRRPYSVSGELLAAVQDLSASGTQGVIYRNEAGEERAVHHWQGPYATLPHVFALLFEERADLADVLMTSVDTMSLAVGFRTLICDRDLAGLQRTLGMLRDVVSRFLTPEITWVLSGDEVPLDLSEGAEPLCLAMPETGSGPGGAAGVMRAFLLDRFLQVAFRRPSSARPLGVFLGGCPTALADCAGEWLRRAESARVSLTVGLDDRFQLSPEVGERSVRKLYGRLDTVVASPATEEAAALDRPGGTPSCNLRTLFDGLSPESPYCVAGIADGGDCGRVSFSGILPRPLEEGGEDVPEEAGPTEAEMYDNLHRIKDDVRQLVDRILGQVDGCEAGEECAPSVPEGGSFMDGLLGAARPASAGGQDSASSDAVPADDVADGGQPVGLPPIEEDLFRELYRKAADDHDIHRDMQV